MFDRGAFGISDHLANFILGDARGAVRTPSQRPLDIYWTARSACRGQNVRECPPQIGIGIVRIRCAAVAMLDQGDDLGEASLVDVERFSSMAAAFAASIPFTCSGVPLLLQARAVSGLRGLKEVWPRMCPPDPHQ